MLTWSGLQLAYQNNTNDVSAANLTFGKVAMNRGYHKLVRAGNFDFPELRTALTSVDGTYVYTLPPQFSKIKEVVWERTGQFYPLQEIGTLNQWDILYNADTKGDPQFYMPRKAVTGYNTWELWLYPIPSESSITIRVTYLRLVPDLSADDYTTGTITATNGSTAITGAGTTFTAAMVGRSIQLPDGLWYDIASFTSTTSIALTYAYQGTTTAGATYTIGQIPLIPHPHHDAIYAYAVAEYYQKRRELNDAGYWRGVYELAKKELETDRLNRTTSQVIRGGRFKFRSINDYPLGRIDD
jgi:hypothetical protein